MKASIHHLNSKEGCTQEARRTEGLEHDTMKSSLSSTTRSTTAYGDKILVSIPFLLFLITSSTLISFSEAQSHHNQQQVVRHHFCPPISAQTPPHIRFQPQSIRHCPPFPPPPPSPDDNEIDPRYGVEKRLVPSGPNPLHN
ncbi:Uncharacterized protein Fot_15928 [Forsythia ovata]|uniref:CLAVATA3/ESR (CLE)-related protein 9 n=1 Tax=Forsythia ovata TaxID=205694 RepID=A0ABD1WE85_9LAMI